MLKLLLLLVVLFAIAFGFQLLSDTPGEVALTLGDTVYAVNLTTAAITAIVLFLILAAALWLLRAVIRSPWRMARGLKQRNRKLGQEAVARGLVAIAAGDARAAERAMLEATRRSPGEPLTRLLQAQAAQIKGDRVAARDVFRAMTDDPATRIAGLRGLYVEAEREGENQAAHQIAERARAEAPSAPWAVRALMRHQTAAADWDGALQTLSDATDGRILDKRTARRQRAVILTAKARDKEEGEPDQARQAALEAHDLAPDLVPAAVIAGRLLARQGDIRRATRILESSWRANPHPETADAYVHVRSGDAASDRLKRAEALHRMRPEADDGRLAVARAAIDSRDFSRARQVLAPVLTKRPTRNAFILMGELAEAETGDRGRTREWLARAVNAPRGPAWTADGVVLEEWAPVSPVTGRLDAVEWKVPLAELEGPKIEISAAELMPPRTVADASAAKAPTSVVPDVEKSGEKEGAAQSREHAAVKTVKSSGPAAASPPKTVTVATSGAAEPAVEPPRPDDPGVAPTDEDDESDRQAAR